MATISSTTIAASTKTSTVETSFSSEEFAGGAGTVYLVGTLSNNEDIVLQFTFDDGTTVGDVSDENGEVSVNNVTKVRNFQIGNGVKLRLQRRNGDGTGDSVKVLVSDKF